MTILYGIKNCDSVKKARKWLENKGQKYQFHDFRTDGLEQITVANWLAELGHERFINRRSTSWKQLSEAQRMQLNSPPLDESAHKLLLQIPTLIKRPVLSHSGSTLIGFQESEYQKLFN